MRQHRSQPEAVPPVKAAKIVPPERSTGDLEADKAIRAGGGIPGGVMGRLEESPHVKMFHDPTSGTTLGFTDKEQVTPEAVKAKLEASRAQYAAAEKKRLDILAGKK